MPTRMRRLVVSDKKGGCNTRLPNAREGARTARAWWRCHVGGMTKEQYVRPRTRGRTDDAHGGRDCTIQWLDLRASTGVARRMAMRWR